MKATHECSALMMFDVLKTLARRDVDTRNKQVEGRHVFALTEIDGITFSVSKNAGMVDRVHVKVTDDLSTISVTAGDNPQEHYTVGLDAYGRCKLRRGDVELDPWQVLKAALEPTFFG